MTETEFKVITQALDKIDEISAKREVIEEGILNIVIKVHNDELIKQNERIMAVQNITGRILEIIAAITKTMREESYQRLKKDLDAAVKQWWDDLEEDK